MKFKLSIGLLHGQLPDEGEGLVHSGETQSSWKKSLFFRIGSPKEGPCLQYIPLGMPLFYSWHQGPWTEQHL